MGGEFGHLLDRVRIVSFALTQYHLKTSIAMMAGGGVWGRRLKGWICFIIPPFATGFAVYQLVEIAHHKSLLKKPGQYDNE